MSKEHQARDLLGRIARDHHPATLAGKRAWITGMRRSQASSRTDVAIEENDPVHGLRKFNPLADWSEEEVWADIRRYDVPYNPLYEQGYRSIGCAPCTRPVAAGMSK